MRNVLAVYSPKAPLTGQKLARIAEQDGLQVRYLALGAYIASDATRMQSASLTSVYGGARMIVGAFQDDLEKLAELDAMFALGDRTRIAAMLKDGKLPWCELYVQRFNYKKWIQRSPRDKEKIDGSVPEHQLAALTAARTRYIIDNQSRLTDGRRLMQRLTDLLARDTSGIVSDHQQPSR